MKLDNAARERFRILIQNGREKTGLSLSEIAKRANIDQGQASRICKGDIKTLSFNVMQICNVLGVDPEPTPHVGGEGEVRRQFAEQAMRLWDRTPEGVERVLRLFRLLEEMKNH